MNIHDLEVAVQAGLEALRTITLDKQAESAKTWLLPNGYTPIVELRNHKWRKKRSTAVARNWDPAEDRIVISFRSVVGRAPTSGEAAFSIPSTITSPSTTLPPADLDAGDVKKRERGKFIAELDNPAVNIPESKVESAIAVTAQEVIECCQVLAHAERSNKHFIGLKWFRDELLATVGYEWARSPQGRQQVLSNAIAMGRIDTKKIPNPKLSAYPTTGITLNRAVPIPGVTSRFNPVPIRGESASITLLGDRGSF